MTPANPSIVLPLGRLEDQSSMVRMLLMARPVYFEEKRPGTTVHLRTGTYERRVTPGLATVDDGSFSECLRQLFRLLSLVPL